MIKAASACAAAPLFYPGSVTEGITSGVTGIAAMPVKKFGDGRDWFFEKRYGMFIHWGLYSIPAWHEQHKAQGPINQ
ncbi:MAG: hypothetical protein A2Y87_01780 [Bacteroidetes bacterium RBG_13_46_8]|nr:MAG: hypothetical protein A2Y87_01780 [Bacteroidetes bacterium RBG_13_46_8]